LHDIAARESVHIPKDYLFWSDRSPVAIVLDAPFHRQPEIDKQRPLVNGPFAVVELRRILWRSDVNVDFQLRINKAVNKLRDVLDDTHQSPCYIETFRSTGIASLRSWKVHHERDLARHITFFKPQRRP